MAYPYQKSDSEWKQDLTAEQYRILRKKGTERAFTGDLNSNKASGTYHCVGCDQLLFESESKYDSGTGWPSFVQAVKNSVQEIEDNSLWMKRTEIVCSNCGSHLGHVFSDGPAPTYKRYCINSVSLKFKPDSEATD